MARLSPSGLNDFLGCEHRTYLDLLVERGELAASERKPPGAELLAERGEAHERAFLEDLRAAGHQPLSLDPRLPVLTLAEQTESAMRNGVGVIHQAAFVHDGWSGRADFLIRVEEPSALGTYGYEVHDAKLARHAQPAYIFQLLFYTEQVERIQGRRPRRMHLILGDGERPPFAPEDFDAYAREVRARFLERRDALAAGADPAYPYPVADCDLCPWWQRCDAKRREDDHLSLVAGLRRRQGLELEAEGVHTVPAVAALDGHPLARQADLQARSRGLHSPLHEFLEPEAGRGFARLPERSEGDVHLDFEGDPFWGTDGLEFLFGTGYLHAGEWRYDARWATGPAQERANFEAWMAWITDRLETYPDLHVFHYHHYEPTALKRLMQRHGVCEEWMDELLRRTVLVDLHGVVRQALRIGTERYTLKALEPVFGFTRAGETADAAGALRHWQAYKEDGERSHLDAIATYNENDCKATAALLDWLYERRAACEAHFGVDIAALEPQPPSALSDGLTKWIARVEAIRARLGDCLLSELVDYHRHEAKPAWWTHFARLDRTDEQLRDEDAEAIGGLHPAPGLERVAVAQSFEIPLAFPPQRFKLAAGKAVDPAADKDVVVARVDERDRVVWIKRGRTVTAPLPTALLPEKPRLQPDHQDAIATVAEAPGALATSLLERRPPRTTGGPDLGSRVLGLRQSAIVVQGPPGAGKTYTGARLAVALMEQGKRVGIAANAHKAVINLLEEIDATGYAYTGLKKGDAATRYESGNVATVDSRNDMAGAQLLAGTTWFWTWAGMRDSVDVLLVDEAGQVALADALAISLATDSMVLLGDPQQLAHVSQGTHPPGAGASVLQHLLGDRPTVPPELGELLDTTYRMHPDVCRFVSETMYDGKLHPVAGLERQAVSGEAGLRLIDVAHDECTQSSPREAEAIREEVDRLLAGGTFTDRDGRTRPLTLADILVVAPYNAQVRCLAQHLPPGARVGTVDKFQGQQAPVVFFSMTSSSGEDVPRGMDFLFSRNRLNVAVSRAQALAVVVASPRLRHAPCNTVDQMRLVNMLCRFAAAAR